MYHFILFIHSLNLTLFNFTLSSLIFLKVFNYLGYRHGWSETLFSKIQGNSWRYHFGSSRISRLTYLLSSVVQNRVTLNTTKSFNQKSPQKMTFYQLLQVPNKPLLVTLICSESSNAWKFPAHGHVVLELQPVSYSH